MGRTNQPVIGIRSSLGYALRQGPDVLCMSSPGKAKGKGRRGCPREQKQITLVGRNTRDV